MYYDKGANDGRRDTTYSGGTSASYKLTDWANFSCSATYTQKETNGNLSPEFKDFVGGVTIGFSHAFNFKYAC